MALAFLLALQAATGAGAAPGAPLAIDFDLARYQRFDSLAGPACDRADPSAIVVCGPRRGGAYPLEAMARIFEPRHFVAETRLIGNLVGGVRVEQVAMDRGAVSNRVMLELRLPF